ncbi:uncharacterized protein MONBRDRAFT_37340 [Monosiga brevicollis MX1]|uniref:Shikimate dehydrogenase substrate binding N-terminal domain-containing protein n=1 Tax=Monosiga brevicollis TaxID=81824 RepID=A9V143_MONBE|nr:uncharacterized protein MONBRDRAFT_37340 [Monosiga brevicollis MX1]EDQ88868.1 predicted protein [Monosiga brevicollis MX1]|eukprot:XP_001746481.1 hypothetical protein [Monosiga brevicollis MX1]
MTTPKDPKHVMLFIGVNTGASRSRELFPVFGQAMGLINVELRGVDFPPDTAHTALRPILQQLRDTPLMRGALITTHKLAAYEAGADMFASCDDLAHEYGEVSCIYKDEKGQLHGWAADFDINRYILRSLLESDHFARHANARAIVMGAGGAGLSVVQVLGELFPNVRIDLTDVDAQRLAWAHRVCQARQQVSVVDVRGGSPGNGELITAGGPGSFVVNATGLGKDRPGSPLAASDFQWPGWTTIMAKVFGVELTDDLFEHVCQTVRTVDQA